MAKAHGGLADLPAAAPLMPMAPPQLSSNTALILALMGAEILSLMAFLGVCELRAKDIALCKSMATGGRGTLATSSLNR
jgi:hypothetical protein